MPIFVVAGQPNKGKTTVVATLTEDDKAEISPIAGQTIKAHRYPVKIDGRERFVLIDTPGFQNSGEILEWFKANTSLNKKLLLEQFCRDFGKETRFHEDIEILKSLLEDEVAVIMVVNPDNPPEEEDEFQAEIFRLAGLLRVGLVNQRSENPRFLSEWKHLLKRTMNTWQVFDACDAVFRDRINLLNAFAAANPDWKIPMAQVIEDLESEWRDRLTQVGRLAADTLQDAITYRIEIPIGEDSREKMEREAKKKVQKKIRKLERSFRDQVRKIFRHNEDHWELGKDLDTDIFSEETWALFGFSKFQLALGAAAAGAGLAAVIDLALGGFSFGVFTLAGGVIAGVAAYLAADNAVHIELMGQKLGGKSIHAGIEQRSKLPGILLDRMSCYAVAAARWAHGRRRKESEKELSERDAWRLCYSLEKSKEYKRLIGLVELWHRSASDNQKKPSPEKMQEAKDWLIQRFAELLKKMTDEE